MNRQVVFTVVIPTYNREHFLKRTIDSILSQTFSDFELIIVDDGSVDNTKKLIDTYRDDRIVYIYKENGGQNSAINAGVQNANGEYIAFCDSDDVWMPEKLEKHIQKYREDKEIKVVYNLTGIVKLFDGEQKVILAREDICEGWCYKEVLQQGYLTAPSFLSCKRECFDKIGMLPTELRNCQDDDLCFRLCKHFKVGLVKEILGISYEDAANRISRMARLCADDFYKLWRIWGSEVIQICGKETLRKKYLQASYLFLGINEMDSVTETYEEACKLGDVSLEKMKSRIEDELQGNGEIIIYGMGDWGKRIYHILRMIGFEKFMFVVTSINRSPGELYGMHAKEIDSLEGHRNSVLVVASSRYYDAMKLTAEKNGFTNIVSYQQIADMIFDR